MADMMYGAPPLGTGGDITNATVADDGPATNDFYGGSNYGGATNMNSGNIQPRQRLPGLYVGNLTWWTTDRDVIDAINSIGINDVQEVKFFENRNNGQSKGFCMVTFTSDASLPIVIEKLPLKELHGQNPVVTPYNRQNLNIFEAQTKPRPQINQSTNGPNSHGIMGINSITGVHAAANAQATGLAVAGMPYAAGLNATAALGGFNQPAVGLSPMGGNRPSFQPNFRMGMRGPRPMMRGTMPGSMNNGPMMQGGHQMNRMRFMQPQTWNNSPGVGGGGGGGGGYNPVASRMGPQASMDISNRLGGGMGLKQDGGQDMLSGSGAQGYYSSHHHNNSQSDHYRGDMRDHRDRDLRDERESRRLDERSARLDERSLRHDDRLSRDDRSLKSSDRMDRSRRSDEILSSRRELEERSSRRSGGGASDDIIRRERDDRSPRRDEKERSSSARHKESRSHRSGERVRSRSRSKERSRRVVEEVKERRGGERERERDRDRERERDRDRDRERERERDRRERY